MRLFTGRNPFKRLYRISLSAAFFVVFPLLLLAGWMIVDAVIEYHRFIKIVARDVPSPSFNTTVMHWHLRDKLKYSYGKLKGPPMPDDEQLQTLQMSIDPENIAQLNSDLPKSGKDRYYKAFVKYEDKSYTVKVRYRGGGHWHWNYPQKSWRVKTKKKKLINGLRKINLVNPKTILSFEESFSMKLAAEIGLLAPKCEMVKLVINNQYTGVYYLLEQVDESLLRRMNKMPGSIYSDDHMDIWKNPNSWKKVASRNAEQDLFRDDIDQLITAVDTFSLADFYQYTKNFINIDQYSLYLSFDSISGTAHHDYVHNFKLYFDPILGKFESIPWDQHLWHPLCEVKLEMANPLLNKWKLITEFDLVRHKTLWRLLNTQLTTDKMLALFDNYVEIVRPALKADAYRDVISGSYRDILKFPKVGVVSFTMKAFEQEAINVRKIIIERHKFLSDYLKKDAIFTHLEKSGEQSIKFTSKGNVGVVLKEIELKGTGSGIVEIYKDLNRDGNLGNSDIVVAQGFAQSGRCVLKMEEQLLPGYKVIRRSPPSPLWGDTMLVKTGLEYEFILDGDFSVDSYNVTAANAVTGDDANVVFSVAPEDSAQELLSSLHPWDIERQSENEKKILGPGLVLINEDMVVPEHIKLTILPGTTLSFAEGVSIFCYGQVFAQGSLEKPIYFKAACPDKPWGVFALQGSGADGSKFAGCSWEDGSVDSRNLINYSGMVSMHDIDDLSIKNCRIGRNHVGDDGLHLAYCKNFSVDNSLFEDARSDAFDIDISDGKVISSRFVRSGNDALDFMTSEAIVDRCYFASSGDKGISAGEKSNLAVDRSVFEYCNIGMEIKDRSIVDFKENVIRNSQIAINLYKKNWRYNGGGKLVANTVFAIDCQQGVKQDKKSEVLVAKVDNSDPFLSAWKETKKTAGCCTPQKTNRR